MIEIWWKLRIWVSPSSAFNTPVFFHFWNIVHLTLSAPCSIAQTASNGDLSMHVRQMRWKRLRKTVSIPTSRHWISPSLVLHFINFKERPVTKRQLSSCVVVTNLDQLRLKSMLHLQIDHYVRVTFLSFYCSRHHLLLVRTLSLSWEAYITCS